MGECDALLVRQRGHHEQRLLVAPELDKRYVRAQNTKHLCGEAKAGSKSTSPSATNASISSSAIARILGSSTAIH